MKPCPVCEGAGHWDRHTGCTDHTKPPRGDLQRCPYCEGTGGEPERQPAF